MNTIIILSSTFSLLCLLAGYCLIQAHPGKPKKIFVFWFGEWGKPCVDLIIDESQEQATEQFTCRYPTAKLYTTQEVV